MLGYYILLTNALNLGHGNRRAFYWQRNINRDDQDTARTGKKIMLRGLQTLQNLVGKRNKFLDSSGKSVLSDNEVQGVAEPNLVRPLLPASNAYEGVEYYLPLKEKLVPNVACPVCKRLLSSDDLTINHHLDRCLASSECRIVPKGRKKIQPTLPQLCSQNGHKLKNQECASTHEKLDGGYPHSLKSCDRPELGALKKNREQPVPLAGKKRASEFFFGKASCVEPRNVQRKIEGDSHLYKVGNVCGSNPRAIDSCTCSCHGAPGFDSHDISGQIIHSAKVGVGEVPCAEINKSTGTSFTGKTCSETSIVLRTKIVGRSFHKEVRCTAGLAVSAQREPNNTHDVNAIQIVVQGDRGEVAGHLPRTVARHLALLLDQNLLTIQGIVCSNEDEPTAVAEVELMCAPWGHVPDESAHLISQGLAAAIKAAALLSVDEVPQPAEASVALQRRARRLCSNFVALLQSVNEFDGHLFDEEEKCLLESLEKLTLGAQILFIRLYQRKGPWFRVGSIAYDDICDLEGAVNELVDVGAFCNGRTQEAHVEKNAVREWLDTFTVPELRALHCKANAKGRSEVVAARREDLLVWAKEALADPAGPPLEHPSLFSGGKMEALTGMVISTCGPCVRVSAAAAKLMRRVQRVFFLNGEQDLALFALSEMGLRRYPDYTCLRTGPVFRARSCLLDYEKALELAQEMNEAVEQGQTAAACRLLTIACAGLAKASAGPDPQTSAPEGANWMFIARFRAEWVYTAMATLGVSLLEREQRYEEAVQVLQQVLAGVWCPGRRGFWTVRLALDLHHLGRVEEGLRVAESGVSDPWIRGGDLLQLQRRVVRLARPPRRWHAPSYGPQSTYKCPERRIFGRPLNRSTGSRSRFYGYDNTQCSVEQLALQFYGDPSHGAWRGVHSEGGVWRTLFALLLWDCIFAPVPDVFRTPFQTAPLDLRTDAFYPARRTLIEARLAEIRNGKAVDILAGVWAAHHGTLCAGLSWERFTLAQLQTMAVCIGGSGLAQVCSLLARDYAGWASGMPDLLLWRLNQRVPCTSCLCKTESARDRKQARLAPGLECTMWSSEAFQKGSVAGSSVGEAMLVEVKGPRDQLSDQQRAWLAALASAGLTVEVCKVMEDKGLLRGLSSS